MNWIIIEMFPHFLAAEILARSRHASAEYFPAGFGDAAAAGEIPPNFFLFSNDLLSLSGIHFDEGAETRTRGACAPPDCPALENGFENARSLSCRMSCGFECTWVAPK